MDCANFSNELFALWPSQWYHVCLMTINTLTMIECEKKKRKNAISLHYFNKRFALIQTVVAAIFTKSFPHKLFLHYFLIIAITHET